jgi:hypothetical protein
VARDVRQIALAHRAVYTGVARLANGTFQAQISDGGSSVYLGVFATARDAALAYNVAHRILRGLNCKWADQHPPNDVEPAIPCSELEEMIAAFVRSAKRKTGRPPGRKAES